MTAELNLELCLFEEECPNHSNRCSKSGYPDLHCFCSTCVECSSPVLKLPANGCRMLCSCRGMMLFAGHCGLKSVGELLVIFQFVAWSWILDKNLISTKQVDFLCRPFPFFFFNLSRGSPQPQQGAMQRTLLTAADSLGRRMPPNIG